MIDLIEGLAFEELYKLKMQLSLDDNERKLLKQKIVKPSGNKLTSRQHQILIRLTWKKAHIADELDVSENTINVIINRLKKEFKVETTNGLLIKALKDKIISLEEIKL